MTALTGKIKWYILKVKRSSDNSIIRVDMRTENWTELVDEFCKGCNGHVLN